MNSRPSSPASPGQPTSLPLAKLLGHTADAVQAVMAGRSLNVALARCPADARPGTQALSFHVLRWLGSATAARSRLAPKPPPPPVDALLLSALALLWPQSDSPYAEHTLVDQAVTAARQRQKGSAAFVNAVMRRFIREREAIVADIHRTMDGKGNHPAWWVQRLERDWPDHWRALLAADNRHPPMTLRVNARRGTPQGYVGRLAAIGMAATVTGPYAVTLERPCPVTRLPGFADGDVSVQDASAQLAAPLLIGDGLPPNARVLDACAAPGGKTAHLLELADLDVLAVDSDPARLARVEETLARLGLKARVVAADASQPGDWAGDAPFDAILLDAPCSASGIVRRHPDVRWLRRAADIPALAALQARLLDALWLRLKPGGRLLYCTCSIFRAEGADQIDAFLQRRVDAFVPVLPPSPGHLLPLADNPDEARRSPHVPTPDGFFYTLLAKR